MTPDERVTRGKTARAKVPRESHAALDLPSDRPDPISLLEEQSAGRVPELVPVRYGRMMVSPFTYYRGAALPMASDLASTPVSGLAVQACGDAHLSNFGVFGSAERKLVFDVNDFDETLPGPWEWDVKRLAASLEVAGRESGFPARSGARSSPRRCRVTGPRCAASRTWATSTSGTRPPISTSSARSTRASSERRQRRALAKGRAKALTSDSMQALGKLTRVINGRPRIISDPPLLVPVTELLAGQVDRKAIEAQMIELIGGYQRTLEPSRRYLLEQFSYADMARKVVGVGSVGTRCWIVLVLGSHSEPLFLQVKEAEPSVLSRFAGTSQFDNEGERVVAGQRLMQASSDIFLGWQRVGTGADGQHRDFYIRQLRDWKFSLDVGRMVPRGMRLYAELCGWTLARAHARSGDRIAIAAYLGSADVFDRAITEFAGVYADQNERDHQALVDAAASGRITAAKPDA